MTKKLGIIIGLLAVVSVAAGVFIVAISWDRPLGPPLPGGDGGDTDAANDLEGTLASPLPTTTPVPTATEEVDMGATQTALALQDLAKPSATLSPAPTPFCGGPSEIIILAVGTDSRPDSYLYGLGDVIRIVRADFANKGIRVLSIPRDLWVEIPELEDRGITYGKLSQAFSWGTEGMGYYESEAGGAGLLALTLKQNFGVEFDRYFTVNMKTFKYMVDAIGGVFVYVPVTMDGRTNPQQPRQPKYGYFTEGNHYLDGGEALMFARIRKMDNDFRRQERQTQLLKEIRKRVLSPEIIDAVPELIDTFRDNVLTDLSPEEITQLTCLALSLDASDISYTTLDQEFYTSFRTNSGQAALRVDVKEFSRRLRRFVEGSWPR